MSARRIVGIETEYGIAVPGNPAANSMLTSSQVVNAYASATARARRARWAFEEESPLRDARGFERSREAADPSHLTDEEIGTTCCFATQDKVWVTGPAGEKWEVYTVLADSETFGSSPRHLDPTQDGGTCCVGAAADKTNAEASCC